MRVVRSALVALSCVFLTFAPGRATALVRALQASDAQIKPVKARAIVLFDENVERLYLDLDVEFESDARTPMAWVIPVPTAPSRMGIANAEFFDWVQSDFAIQDVTTQKKSRGAAGKESPVEELPGAVVGPYQFQPLKVAGEEAVEALNAWLRQEGFAPVNPKAARYYAKRGWTFVAVKSLVKFTPGTTLQHVDGRSGTGLPAIVLEFGTPAPVVPLKLLATQASVSAEVWLLSSKKFAESAFKYATRKARLELIANKRKGPKWKSLSKNTSLLRDSVYLSELAKKGTMADELTSFFGESKRVWGIALRGNVSKKKAKRWKEDLHFGSSKTRLDVRSFESPVAPVEPAPIVEADTVVDTAEDTAEPEVLPEGADVVDDAENLVESASDAASGVDWTLVLGIIAVAFFVITVGGIELRRRL